MNQHFESSIIKAPKAEFHLHIEGALPLNLLAKIDSKFEVGTLPTWNNSFRFADFSHFDETLLGMAVPFYNTPERYAEASEVIFKKMLAQNIKSGFYEYIDDPYLKEEIQENYDELNINVSQLDVEFKTSTLNAANKTIVVSDDLFKYLEKYGFTVISLEENDNLNAKIISDAKKLINSGTIEYIFIKNGEEVNNTINNLISETGVKTESINTLSNLTEKERDENLDYITIMKSNIEKLRKELYK